VNACILGETGVTHWGQKSGVSSKKYRDFRKKRKKAKIFSYNDLLKCGDKLQKKNMNYEEFTDLEDNEQDDILNNSVEADDVLTINNNNSDNNNSDNNNSDNNIDDNNNNNTNNNKNNNENDVIILDDDADDEAEVAKVTGKRKTTETQQPTRTTRSRKAKEKTTTSSSSSSSTTRSRKGKEKQTDEEEEETTTSSSSIAKSDDATQTSTHLNGLTCILCGEYPDGRDDLIDKITNAGGVVVDTILTNVNACILGTEGQTYWGYKTGKKSKKYKKFVSLKKGKTYTYEEFLDLEENLKNEKMDYSQYLQMDEEKAEEEEEPLPKKKKRKTRR